MSTTGKTPISLLSEMLMRRRIQPIYNLLMSGAGTNQGLFIYEVTAGDLKARGRGRSKKEAKQDAATAALQAFKCMDTMGTSCSEDALPLPDLNVISPYQEQLRENVVGNLGELCANSQLPAPEYHLIREDGPPHAKLFEIACRVSSFERSAIGRTKQQAKHMAAKLMLDHLETLKLTITPEPVVVEMDTESVKEREEREELMTSIRAVRSSRGLGMKPSQRSLLGQQMGSRLKHAWTMEKLAEVKKYRVPTTDHTGQLQLICSKLELMVTFREIPSKQGKMMLVCLSTAPELSFLGKGPNCDHARDDAASRALNFFDIMVWH